MRFQNTIKIEQTIGSTSLTSTPLIGQTLQLIKAETKPFEAPIIEPNNACLKFHSTLSSPLRFGAKVQVIPQSEFSLDDINKIIDNKIRKAISEIESRNSYEGELYASIAWVMTESGAAKQTIYGWVNRREIPYYKVGKNLRFKKSEILEWLLKHKKLPRDEINKNIG